VTAPFVYARIMGTTAAHADGYDAAHIKAWAARLKAWAAGEPAAGLQKPVAPPAAPAARDVFLFVIGGEKPRNPAAALAILAALT
jgi:uncharacterized protein YecE (DUF72 family)